VFIAPTSSVGQAPAALTIIDRLDQDRKVRCHGRLSWRREMTGRQRDRRLLREIFTMEMTVARGTPRRGAVKRWSRTRLRPRAGNRCPPPAVSRSHAHVRGGGRYWLDLTGMRSLSLPSLSQVPGFSWPTVRTSRPRSSPHEDRDVEREITRRRVDRAREPTSPNTAPRDNTPPRRAGPRTPTAVKNRRRQSSPTEISAAKRRWSAGPRHELVLVIPPESRSGLGKTRNTSRG
jgi:hypothetical protein